MASPLSPSLDWKLANAKWSASLNPVINNPLNNCSILKDIQLTAGTNVINHLLGRNMQGWFIVDIQQSTAVQVALNAYLSTSPTVTANTNIKYDVVVDDTFSAYNPSTGEFTAPSDGFYQVFNTFDSTSGAPSVYLTVNGAQKQIVSSMNSATRVTNGGGLVRCSQGDAVSLQVDSTVSVSGGPAVSYFSVSRIPDTTPIFRNGPFNDKTLSLFSGSDALVSIGVF